VLLANLRIAFHYIRFDAPLWIDRGSGTHGSAGRWMLTVAKRADTAHRINGNGEGATQS